MCLHAGIGVYSAVVAAWTYVTLTHSAQVFVPVSLDGLYVSGAKQRGKHADLHGKRLILVGEHCQQRAVMLTALCTLHKLRPGTRGQLLDCCLYFTVMCERACEGERRGGGRVGRGRGAARDHTPDEHARRGRE